METLRVLPDLKGKRGLICKLLDDGGTWTGKMVMIWSFYPEPFDKTKPLELRLIRQEGRTFGLRGPRFPDGIKMAVYQPEDGGNVKVPPGPRKNPPANPEPKPKAEPKEPEPIDLSKSRVWTNSEGRTISGKFVGMNGGNVTVLLDSGRNVRLAISNLSVDDQIFLKRIDRQQLKFRISVSILNQIYVNKFFQLQTIRLHILNYVRKQRLAITTV